MKAMKKLKKYNVKKHGVKLEKCSGRLRLMTVD